MAQTLEQLQRLLLNARDAEEVNAISAKIRALQQSGAAPATAPAPSAAAGGAQVSEKARLEGALGIDKMTAEARAGLMSHLLGTFNQQTPFGSMTTEIGPDGRPSTTTTLSPAQQQLLEQQQRAAQMAGRQAIDQIGQLPGAFQLPNFGPGAQTGIGNPFNLQTMMAGNTDFSAERDRVERAQFDRIMALLSPEFERQEQSMLQRLANQGLPQASRAYGAETGTFGDTRNRATEQAALAAILSGGQEQSRLLGDLLGTSQVGIGQAQQQRQTVLGEAVLQHQMPFQQVQGLLGLQQGGQQMPQFFAPSGLPVQPDQRSGGGGLFGDIFGGLAGVGGAFLGNPGLFKQPPRVP